MRRSPILNLATVLLALTVFPTWRALAGEAGYQVKMPLGLDADLFNVPDDNPITEAKIELGKLLYFDGRLSLDGTVSCATCHDPAKGFTDNRRVSKGVNGLTGTRNAPTVINTAFNYFQFWDGRSPSLEDQATGPMQNPVEMRHTLDGAVASISKIEGYKPYFKAAYGDESVDIDRITKAIATFERTVLSGGSPWDRFVYAKQADALSDSAKRGLELFEGKALCTRCHVGFNLTDGLFHNLGVGMSAEKPDLGRYEVTKQESDKGAFKTPTLRDIQKTAPYMHDGSVATLEEVIDLYDKGGEKNPWLDVKVKPLHLTTQEKKDLLAFLMSLEGDWKPTPVPTLPK
jgi:cytochrome c peroxidase